MPSSVGAILLDEGCGLLIAIDGDADIVLRLSKLFSTSATLDTVGGSGTLAASLPAGSALLFESLPFAEDPAVSFCFSLKYYLT